MLRLRSQTGFTLGEFVMVMMIILLLCFAAIPQFFSLRNSNREKKMARTVASVQAGIAAWHYRKLMDNVDTYPLALDVNPINSLCKACFGNVMDKPVESELWFKNSDTEYYFSRNGNSKKPDDFHEKGDCKIIYNPTLGSFIASRIE